MRGLLDIVMRTVSVPEHTCDIRVTLSYCPMSERNWPRYVLWNFPPAISRSALMMAAVEKSRRREAVFQGNQDIPPLLILLDSD